MTTKPVRLTQRVKLNPHVCILGEVGEGRAYRLPYDWKERLEKEEADDASS
ncbi:hypothetical protein [Streptococcus sp. zg-JUN1979]|uniref:hypothetical protein n=1 Tax=Streptococcus sp. zg-JUN1979 TaxID=3391450 RepID=UPI0039A5C68C